MNQAIFLIVAQAFYQFHDFILLRK